MKKVWITPVVIVYAGVKTSVLDSSVQSPDADAKQFDMSEMVDETADLGLVEHENE